MLVSHSGDEHGDALAHALRDRALVHRISLEDLPDSPLAWRPGGSLSLGKQLMRHDRASGFWRRPGAPQVSAFLPRFRSFVEAESRDALVGTLLSLPIQWLTHPADVAQAELKPFQLHVARSLGLRIPPTLVTNRAADATRFIKRFDEAIIKPVRYGLVAVGKKPLVAWTTRVDARAIRTLAGPPVMLQARVRAREHLRLVTTGSKVFACGLPTDAVDWRPEEGSHEAFVDVTGRYPDAEEGAWRLAACLRLGYSSQDWIIDDRRRPTFLEANPSGQWLFLDPMVRGRITESLASALLALS